MAKPVGSKKVECRGKHVNYLLPGTERRCSEPTCRRTVSVPRSGAKKVKRS